jgi:hypothetical protein
MNPQATSQVAKTKPGGPVFNSWGFWVSLGTPIVHWGLWYIETFGGETALHINSYN